MIRLLVYCTLALILGGCAVFSTPQPSMYSLVTTLEVNKAYQNLANVLDLELLRVRSRMMEATRSGRSCDACLEDELFVLDELAQVYTVGLVNFRKATEWNQEALATYRRIRTSGIERISCAPQFFTSHRSLYWLTLAPSGGSPSKPCGGAGDGDVVLSPFPKSLLDAARHRDLEDAHERIQWREQIIRHRLGLAQDSADDTPSETGFRKSPARKEEDKAGNPYYTHYERAQRAWAAYQSNRGPVQLPIILQSGKAALEVSVGHRAPYDWTTTAYLRYWLGVASVRGGHVIQGIEYLQGFLTDIGRYEAHLEENRTRFLEALATLESDREAARRGILVGTLLLNAGMSFAAGALAPAASSATTASQSFAAQAPMLGATAAALTAGTMGSQAAEETAKSARILREVVEYQTLYAMKLNLLLDREEQLEYFLTLGAAYKASGDLRNAVQHYREAISIIENQRETISSEAERIAFLKRRLNAYGDIVSLLVRSGDATTAFEYVERAKSRAFVDLLGSRRVVLKNPQETEAYAATQRRLSEVDMILAQRRISIEQYFELARKRSEFRGIAVQDQTSQVEFLSLSTVKTLGAMETAALLEPNVALIEYFLTEEELFIFLLQGGEVKAATVRIDTGELLTRVAALRDAIEAAGPIRGEPPGSEITDPAQWLYEQLMAPILPSLIKSRLYIVPHGPLHYIPFQALHDGERYIVERFTIAYLPSATVLQFLGEKRKRAEGSDGMLLFANPDLGDREYDLPGTIQEADVIKPSSMGRFTMFARTDATESRAKRLAGEYGILHFATHATFDVSDPFQAALLLAQDGENDGRLTLGEVFGLPLKTSLVVLSACQTGLSRVTPGDELVGLMRAFFYAGTPTIIASLWRVNDASTAELMGALYRNMRTMPKAEALRQAQREMMVKYPHPFHWAPFVLGGHWQ